MKIVWSDRAILHLEKIRQYLLEQDAPEAARRVMARLIETPEALLSDFPRLGRRVEEPGFEAYHELLVDDYLVVYRRRGEGIEISDVPHGAQDRERVLRELLLP